VSLCAKAAGSDPPMKMNAIMTASMRASIGPPLAYLIYAGALTKAPPTQNELFVNMFPCLLRISAAAAGACCAAGFQAAL
jgi:hypothetical protein